MLVSLFMPSKLPFMNSLFLQWTLLFTLLSSCLPSWSVRVSASSSDLYSPAPLWLSLANMTSLRECLQQKQGFYEFSQIEDVINRALPHTNYTLNGVPLTLSAACTRHHYPVAEHIFHHYFAHQPTCSSIQFLPAQSVFFLESEGRQALTLTKVAFCLILLTTCWSVYLGTKK
uniref:GP2b protein n=1 Tax=Mikumi yellow baboon virus 1 TaxID=1546177 RepID=A0A089FYB8_9NIDO|nr:GP2b protein [Mikumi yellow baboon virus 1]